MAQKARIVYMVYSIRREFCPALEADNREEPGLIGEASLEDLGVRLPGSADSLEDMSLDSGAHPGLKQSSFDHIGTKSLKDTSPFATGVGMHYGGKTFW